MKQYDLTTTRAELSLPWANKRGQGQVDPFKGVGSGVLTLSPRVTTDLARLVDAVNAATGAEASEAMVLYASVLDLIEATPAAAIQKPQQSSHPGHLTPDQPAAVVRRRCPMSSMVLARRLASLRSGVGGISTMDAAMSSVWASSLMRLNRD